MNAYIFYFQSGNTENCTRTEDSKSIIFMFQGVPLWNLILKLATHQGDFVDVEGFRIYKDAIGNPDGEVEIFVYSIVDSFLQFSPINNFTL